MKRNYTYHVKYQLDGFWNDPKGIDVLASSKEEAYVKAVYEMILETYGYTPYSAWVQSVTYNNGNHRTFNTFCGKPY